MDMLPVMLVSARVVGWTLLHFVWQGLLLGLLYAVARTVLPRGEARYRFGMAVLVALALCPLLTLWRLLAVAPLVTQTTIAAAAPSMYGHGAVSSPMVGTWDAGLDALLPWLALAWLVGVLLLSLRAWRQWRRLQVLVRMAELMPAWQVQVAAMAERFGLRRRVTVLCSKVIATPAVVGWIRPVILLPMAVVCNFPAGQIELILAHELAHLRRWDPLANLFQVVLETLCFYHPVVHWVSRDVRNEREICCDELALSVSGGSRHEFVTALAELGELRERHASLLLAANGGVLLDRVQHMVMPVHRGMPTRTPARFVAVMLGAALVALTLRLEWKQNHLQQSLTDAVMQLQSIWMPPELPLAKEGAMWHPADLALAHAEVLRPLVIAPSTSADALAGAAPSLVATAAILPHLAPLQVADVTPLHYDKSIAGIPALVADAVPSLESSPTPTPVSIRQPVYPHAALVRGVEGQVVIEFGLSADGDVKDPRVVSAQPAGVFDQAAIDAMREWKYTLPDAAGTSRRYRQAVAFTLNRGRGGNLASGLQTDQEVRARASCQVVTGTHICRGSDEMGVRVVE